MEDSDQKNFDIDFLSLLFNKQKILSVNFRAKIEQISSESEQISLNISSLENKNICYNGFYAIKGEIFPLPKIDDIIEIKEIRYKLNEDFNPGFFIKIIKSEDIDIINLEKKNQILDLTKNNIIKSLTEIINIKETLKSMIFIVIDDSSNDYYVLKCINNNTKYYLIKKTEFLEYSFNKSDIIYIFNFYENKDYIGLTLITLVEKLNDENLFFLLEKNYNNKNKYFLGKVVEIINSNKIFRIILLDESKQLFELKRRNDKIKLGQICLITNYKVLKEDNKLPQILETNESFSYFSSQNLYFSNKIKLNMFSVIQLYFLDFKSTKNNLYNAIKINNERVDIISEKMNIIIESKKMKNYEYSPVSIQLIEGKNGKDISNISFNFNLLHGLLNKINAFINYKNKIPYFYEYLFYYFDLGIYQAKKEIYFAKKKSQILLIYDIFDSSNRLRFNVLNIPFQKECDEKLLNNSNSLTVCEIFTNGNLKPKTVGIFSIDEIKQNTPELKNNNIFDKYYNDFGFIYDNILEIKEQNINEFINICKNKFDIIINKDKNLDFKNISSYEEEISLSQFKTRIGIIISYYLYKSHENEKIDNFENIKAVFSSIHRHKNNLSLLQFFRLFKFIIRKSLNNYERYKICYISELDEFSPYLVAYNFNIDEINKINETSRLFMGYIQIDSYILVNHLIGNSKSYSLSIEPLFMIKNHLLQSYEGFFLIEKSDKEHYAQSITDEKITIINIKKIFAFSNIKIDDIEKIEKKNILRNHAFSLSMEFRHENNSHQKKNQKNIHITSPIYYFDKSDIKKIEFLKNNKIQGEDGRLIEALIDEDRETIISLQADIIYGDLLNINYFIQTNFDMLKKIFKKIKEKKDKFDDKIDDQKNEINKIDSELNSSEKNLYEEKEQEKLYIELKTTGYIMISDEEYSEYHIKEIIKTAKNNNTYEQLPSIIIYIDKRMKEEESEKNE